MRTLPAVLIGALLVLTHNDVYSLSCLPALSIFTVPAKADIWKTCDYMQGHYMQAGMFNVSHVLVTCKHPRAHDLEFFHWPVIGRLDETHPLYDAHARFDTSEDRVLPVQPAIESISTPHTYLRT